MYTTARMAYCDVPEIHISRDRSKEKQSAPGVLVFRTPRTRLYLSCAYDKLRASVHANPGIGVVVFIVGGVVPLAWFMTTRWMRLRGSQQVGEPPAVVEAHAPVLTGSVGFDVGAASH